MITLQNISYQVGEQWILRDISCYLSPGKLIAIVGPNGAGKSSLVRLITREVEPVSGKITWFGRPLDDIPLPELAKSRAVLAQKTHMSLDFAVREVVLMGRYPHFKHVPQPEDHSVVRVALSLTEMSSFENRSYSRLSGGEQQRVQLARAFAQIGSGEGPFVLVLDEPLNNLDLRHQHKVLAYCQEFVAQGNLVLVVLHDLTLAAQYANELLLLKDGRMLKSGSAEQVLEEQVLSAAYDYPVKVFRNPQLAHPIVFSAASTRKKISSSTTSHIPSSSYSSI